MFGKRRRERNCCRAAKPGRGRRGNPRSISSLSEAAASRRYLVLQNPHKQTLEMGIAPHTFIYLHRNQVTEDNLIVGLNEMRLSIPRNAADRIKVR
ncbi:MAG: hypothetical protein R6U84_10030 [Candidatus Cloacimonadales bacterium]